MSDQWLVACRCGLDVIAQSRERFFCRGRLWAWKKQWLVVRSGRAARHGRQRLQQACFSMMVSSRAKTALVGNSTASSASRARARAGFFSRS
jgi:uroporphyrinogen-III synthase